MRDPTVNPEHGLSKVWQLQQEVAKLQRELAAAREKAAHARDVVESDVRAWAKEVRKLQAERDALRARVAALETAARALLDRYDRAEAVGEAPERLRRALEGETQQKGD